MLYLCTVQVLCTCMFDGNKGPDGFVGVNNMYINTVVGEKVDSFICRLLLNALLLSVLQGDDVHENING